MSIDEIKKIKELGIKVKKVAYVYQTEDYSIFEKLIGNRSVEPSRAENLKKSFKEIGYRMNPTMVNEDLAIVEGQGRVEACKQLGLPVFFVVDPGAGPRECAVMNTNMKKWTIFDYINMYDDGGNESYKRFNQLLKDYKGLPFKAIYSALTGLAEFNDVRVKNGKLKVSEEQYENARNTLDFFRRLEPICKRMTGGTPDKFYFAAGFCFAHPEIDKEKLVKKLDDCIRWDDRITTTIDALRKFEEYYNKNAKKDKVYIESEYKKAMDDKYGWYAKRYWPDKEEESEKNNQAS